MIRAGEIQNHKVSPEALALAQTANYYHESANRAAKHILEHIDLRDNLPDGHSTARTLTQGISRLEHEKSHAEEEFSQKVELAGESIPAQGPRWPEA